MRPSREKEFNHIIAIRSCKRRSLSTMSYESERPRNNFPKIWKSELRKLTFYAGGQSHIAKSVGNFDAENAQKSCDKKIPEFHVFYVTHRIKYFLDNCPQLRYNDVLLEKYSMLKFVRNTAVFLICLGVAALIFFYLQDANIPVLYPKGMIGHKQKNLIVLSTLIMLIVVVPVFFLTAYIGWKFRRENSNAKYSPNWDNSHLAEIIWWGLPLIIIVFLSILTWRSSHELDPFKPIENQNKPLTIQVVALRWKWLFIYPEQKIATVNYVQFPDQTPLAFEVTSDAPMNSFWIPQLGGQIYAMPGMKSKLHLIADEPGVYRGSSANLSGKGFASMVFTAESTTAENFNAWASSIQSSSPTLDRATYSELAQPSEKVAPQTYSLADDSLFEQIVMKYMTPETKP